MYTNIHRAYDYKEKTIFKYLGYPGGCTFPVNLRREKRIMLWPIGSSKGNNSPNYKKHSFKYYYIEIKYVKDKSKGILNKTQLLISWYYRYAPLTPTYQLAAFKKWNEKTTTLRIHMNLNTSCNCSKFPIKKVQLAAFIKKTTLNHI